MSVRWYAAMVLVLGVAIVSATSYTWFSRSESLARSSVRQSRVDQQILEQQLLYLQNPGNKERIEGLQLSLKELQLQLVELLSSANAGAGVESIEFEQFILPKVIEADFTSDIITLRLVLNMTAQHSMSMLTFLSSLQQSVLAWPNEVRACDMSRLISSKIRVQCVIDFYYWSDVGFE